MKKKIFILLTILFSTQSYSDTYLSTWSAAYNTCSVYQICIWATNGGYYGYSSIDGQSYSETFFGNNTFNDYNNDGEPDFSDPNPDQDPDPEPNEQPEDPPVVTGSCPIEGWYFGSDNLCHPSSQEHCEPDIYVNEYGGYCQNAQPGEQGCPLDFKYNIHLDECQFTGEISGTPNPELQQCVHPIITDYCYDPYTGEVFETPPYCTDLTPSDDPTIECRTAEGEAGAPPIDDGEGGTKPPPEGGGGTYGFCKYPLPICANDAYTCYNFDYETEVVPACTTEQSTSDGGGGSTGGGSTGGTFGSGGDGGIGSTGNDGGEKPEESEQPIPEIEGGIGSGGGSSPSPSSPNPSGDSGETEEGTSGGQFNAGNTPTSEEGVTGGYEDAINSLCGPSGCESGPSCLKDFCNAQERIGELLGYSFNVNRAYGTCPSPSINLNVFFNLGTFTLDGHCLILETIRNQLQSVLSVVILVTSLFIVLEA